MAFNLANKDANRWLSKIPQNGNNDLSISLSKQTKLLEKIATKKELHLGAGDKGMVALWKWGANQTAYIDQNTNF